MRPELRGAQAARGCHAPLAALVATACSPYAITGDADVLVDDGPDQLVPGSTSDDRWAVCAAGQ